LGSRVIRDMGQPLLEEQLSGVGAFSLEKRKLQRKG